MTRHLSEYDWSAIAQNPVSPAVLSYVRRELLTRRRRTFALMPLLARLVRGKRVLDVGVVEHDSFHYNSHSWKHEQIRALASYVLGIDILEEHIATLRERGYNVVVADATSARDLGERFDRVLLGDVIEHVDSAVALLEFAKRHLSPGGQVVVTTPNPFFYSFVFEAVRSAMFIPNADHLAWIGPSMALELGRRTGLRLDEYWLLQNHGSTWWKRCLHWLRDIWFADSELFAWAFVFIYSLEPEPDCASPK